MASIIDEGVKDLEMGVITEPSLPSPTPSPRVPALVLSNSGKSLAGSNSGKSLAGSNSDKSLAGSNSGKSLVVSNSGKALILSNSGKRMDQSGKKKYVKQVTGRHNDTELHLAAQKGDAAAVSQILGEINEQMQKTSTGAEFDARLAEIRIAVVNEVNELGETPLFIAAERGHIDVVNELLPYTTKKGITTRNKSRFNPLHIAASQGHLDIVHILLERDPELSNTVGQSNATPLTSAATKGHLAVVNELLSKDPSLIEISNSDGQNALHLAALQGHVDIVKALLENDTQLARRTDQKGQTALHMAALQGHEDIVNELLSKDPSLIEISKSNGKNALHLAARQGHVDIVKALLEKDTQLVRRTDKKGRTALHMAALQGHEDIVEALLRKGTALVRRTDKKGQTALHMAALQGHRDIVNALLQRSPQLARKTDEKGRTALHMAVEGFSVMLPDKFGNTALHVATRKKHPGIVHDLLQFSDTNVNALTRDYKTALDIAAESLPFSEEKDTIIYYLIGNGAVRANELNQPLDELRETISEIKKNVHAQLEQHRETNKNVNDIAKEFRKKFDGEGINNATISLTAMAVLFVTAAFAAMFTVPGGYDDKGMAVTVRSPSFMVFFISDAVALFTSLAVVVVVVQITVVGGEIKFERRVVEVINKLMWLASVSITVAFIASSYIVVGRHNKWAAILVTVIGGIIMAGVLGTMTFYMVKSRWTKMDCH